MCFGCVAWKGPAVEGTATGYSLSLSLEWPEEGCVGNKNAGKYSRGFVGEHSENDGIADTVGSRGSKFAPCDVETGALGDERVVLAAYGGGGREHAVLYCANEGGVWPGNPGASGTERCRRGRGAVAAVQLAAVGTFDGVASPRCTVERCLALGGGELVCELLGPCFVYTAVLALKCCVAVDKHKCSVRMGGGRAVTRFVDKRRVRTSRARAANAFAQRGRND